MKVMLVFDEAYGKREERELGDAFWLVESPANRAIAEQAWATSSTDPNSAVFKGKLPATEQDVLGKVSNIELHHPDWTEIVLVGVEPTAGLTREMEVEGLSIKPMLTGLSIRRRTVA